MEMMICSVFRSRRRSWLLMVVLSLAACGLLWGVFGVLAEALPNPSPPESGLSQRKAAIFQSKLLELSSTGPIKSGSLRPIVFTDDEVNSFLKYDRVQALPPSVKDFRVHFKPEGIYGSANVNFDQLNPTQQLGDQLGASLLASIFKGTQRVSALGQLASSNGTATLTVKDVQIGSTKLSDWLVNWLIQTYVESEYKIDLSKPFLLPNQVLRINFAPGQAIFIRGIRQKK